MNIISRSLNEHFVSIKVDREERPDLDQIYMQAVQMLTGRGGWPMSVFLTPDLKPFYGGTYWPPTSRPGMPGFDRVLAAVADAWKNRREQAVEQAEQLTRHLRQFEPAAAAASELHLELLWTAEKDLLRSFDAAHGGFGQAPKFPHPMALQLALRIGRRRPRSRLLELVQLTLDMMWRGGIYDHLGGGFARYSVDDRWLVPHFEKMLYDNALLADAYLDFYRVTGQPDSARVVRETLDYVLRDMTDPSGGFHSAEDADSEGEEGKFYLWTPDEVRQALGREAAERFCSVYDVTDEGNFEGRNILNLPQRVEPCAAAKGWDVRQLEPELAASRGCAACSARPPDSSGQGRQGADRLERADDPHAGPRWRDTGRADDTWKQRRRLRRLSSRKCVGPTVGCCTSGAGARRGMTPTWTITLSSSMPW